jgi:HlyD family secretion protein
VGASDGSRTAITSGDLKAGMRVITGQLAAGQEQPADDQADRGGQPKTPSPRSPATDGSPASVGKLGNSTGAPPETAPVAPTKRAPDRRREP